MGYKKVDGAITELHRHRTTFMLQEIHHVFDNLHKIKKKTSFRSYSNEREPVCYLTSNKLEQPQQII